ncbi:hypothetical protein FDP41_003826 [Naegleria fowleri]|uniref:SUEL-type lectin domain-containing protein n=1 Tax=Naegleria fowleri TaxID=5763 RepID=A0A6A5BH07_NAEFO|nr:uncharacterized protein FDP41_003826 [Naegleria fowleri]KAF0977173.1 hypothetical protein FDP41_003826 [Naegleria fowleri]CAG4711949.1 unnamed protein product [Naegleria fowleri]
MLLSRSNTFLLSASAFLLLVLVSSTVQAQYQLLQTFPGLTCSGKAMVQVYTPSSLCKASNCTTNVKTYVGDYSASTTCTTTIPLSPKVGEYMILSYQDSKCSGNPSSVSIIALDTCIPAANMTYGSVMYKGCKSVVTYKDQNCKTEDTTVPNANVDCVFGLSLQCSGAAEFMLRGSTGIVVSVMIAVLMMIFYL